MIKLNAIKEFIRSVYNPLLNPNKKASKSPERVLWELSLQGLLDKKDQENIKSIKSQTEFLQDSYQKISNH